MKPIPADFLNGRLVDQNGLATPLFMKFLQYLHVRTPNLDLQGIVTADGADFARSYANKNTDHISDGTGSPIAGGKRGFVALDTNNRLAGSFRSNPVSTFSNFSSTNPVTATTGGSANTATVSIAANTQKYGDGDVNYSSGSITPLNDSTTYYVYADDPTFGGDGVSYQATTNAALLTASNGRVYFGKVTTPAFGGGGTSGTGGGSGGRGNVY